MSTTVNYSPVDGTYYNGSNVNGGSGLVFGSNYKCRLTVNCENFQKVLKGRSVVSAKFRITLGSGIWNADAVTYVGCSLTSSVAAAFPNKSWSGNALEAADSTTCKLYPKNGTIALNATNTVKFALENYMTKGIWYLWTLDRHAGTCTGIKSPQLRVTVDDGSVYVYDGSAWHSAVPHVYANGVWNPAVAYRWTGSSWTALTAPPTSADAALQGPEIFDDALPPTETNQPATDTEGA